MGPSDHTALPADATVESDSVGAVSTDMIATPDAAAERLRHALVDSVRKSGYACTPSVETAMRAVARHLFVPEASLKDAYANATVHIKYDSDGASISCASQPDIVALMLDQLQAQPGHTVLELGAGTGYNAGLLGHIGPATSPPSTSTKISWTGPVPTSRRPGSRTSTSCLATVHSDTPRARPTTG